MVMQPMILPMVLTIAESQVMFLVFYEYLFLKYFMNSILCSMIVRTYLTDC